MPHEMDLLHLYLPISLLHLPARASEHPENFSPPSYILCISLCPQVTPGGSAARAGLQMGDTVLEVNGYPVGGDSDPERLRQLVEAEPPLCLTLAARSQEGLKAWTAPGSGEVRKDSQSWEQPKKGKDKPLERTDWED